MSKPTYEEKLVGNVLLLGVALLAAAGAYAYWSTVSMAVVVGLVVFAVFALSRAVRALDRTPAGSPPAPSGQPYVPPPPARPPEIRYLRQVLRPGDAAVAVKTAGAVLSPLTPGGSGTSGNWVASATRHANRIFLYKREGSAGTVAEIWRADLVGRSQSPEPGRLVFHFRNAQLVAYTRSSWPDFAEAGSGPVRYMDA